MSSKQFLLIVLSLISACVWTLAIPVEASQLDDVAHGRAEGPTPDPFPIAEPASVGVSPAALHALTTQVQSMVDDETIVGGELVVIKNRRTVLRKAFGWKDREAEEAMEVGAVYCVRSMTKPFVGTAIQMLIDEGKLSLDTPVHTILPPFDRPRAREITIEHLLTHTSGLPFITFTRSLAEYPDLGAVAAEAAERELLFEPGSRFAYSDAGSDTLGAVVEAVSGMPVETFMQRRILDPLGMTDTVTLLKKSPEVKARIPSAYSGGTGSWSRHWTPDDPPIFPLFLSSQGLYATTTDYAKFLAWWMDGGEIEGRRLLSTDAVERALTPANAVDGYPAANDGPRLYYGQQWMVMARTDADGERHTVMFGHNGSDGTHAWAWPKEDLIVLFFTQSRGTTSGMALEAKVQTLLVDHHASGEAPSNVAASELGGIDGLYWDQDVEHAYYVVTAQGNRLEIDRPGGGHLVFVAGETPDRFVHEANPKVWVEFVRSEEGDVSAMRTFLGKREEVDHRHVPARDLPTAEEVSALVRRAHRIDLLPGLGVVEMRGTTRLVDRAMRGSITTSFDEARSRTELVFGSTKQTVMIDGDRAWSVDPTTGRDELAGRRKQQELLWQLPVLLGDWSEYYESVEVLKRIVHDGQKLVLVRVVPAGGPGTTIFVDEETGFVLRRDDIVEVPSIGLVGVQAVFGDYRDVGGMKIAFRIETKFQTKLIGRVITEFNRVRTGVKVSAGTFAPRGAR